MQALQKYGQELQRDELLCRAHRAIADCLVGSYSTTTDPLDREHIIDALHCSIDRVVGILRTDEQNRDDQA